MQLFLLCAALGLAAGQSGLQRVAVRGNFFCGDKIAAGVEVELWDWDSSTRAELMGKAVTDADGFFTVAGVAEDFADEFIEPELRVYHDCNNYQNQGVQNKGICQREMVFHIPKNYINNNPRKDNQAIFNIGQMNLELIQPKESQKCPDNIHA